MYHTDFLIFFLLFVVFVKCENVSVVHATSDSYLEAYKDSKALNNVKKISNRDYNVDNGPYPSANYGGDNNYRPDYNYGPPRPVYGPPSYPPPSYGPPGYYPPPEPIYGMPHAMLGLLDKLKLKLDLFTLGKILLKIVLFKKIVSFIGIICLLLFIPSLKHIKGDDKSDEDYRTFSYNNTIEDDRLNRLTTFLSDAITKYSEEDNDKLLKCKSIYCRSKKLLNYINNKISYRRLIDMYSREL